VDAPCGNKGETASVEGFVERRERGGGVDHQFCSLGIKVHERGNLGVDFGQDLVLQTFEFTHNGKKYKELSSERQEEKGMGGIADCGLRIANLKTRSQESGDRKKTKTRKCISI
jgi:hypothetical protein